MMSAASQGALMAVAAGGAESESDAQLDYFLRLQAELEPALGAAIDAVLRARPHCPLLAVAERLRRGAEPAAAAHAEDGAQTVEGLRQEVGVLRARVAELEAHAVERAPAARPPLSARA
jgi:hypothetical protein